MKPNCNSNCPCRILRQWSEKKEKVKQIIKDALPDEQWKIDPEFFDFILDVLIDLVVMFLNRGLWKTAMKVL